MKITSPEQLIEHALAGGEIEFKGSSLEYGNNKIYFPTDSVRFVVPNDILMELNMHDVIKLTQEQEVYTCE